MISRRHEGSSPRTRSIKSSIRPQLQIRGGLFVMSLKSVSSVLGQGDIYMQLGAAGWSVQVRPIVWPREVVDKTRN